MLLEPAVVALALRDTDDPAKARAARNPLASPHLNFVDMGGYGYTTVRASADELVAEFVCIPPPVARAPGEDGGPLRYRVVNRVARWAPGTRPQMRTETLEGDAGLSMV